VSAVSPSNFFVFYAIHSYQREVGDQFLPRISCLLLPRFVLIKALILVLYCYFCYWLISEWELPSTPELQRYWNTAYKRWWTQYELNYTTSGCCNTKLYHELWQVKQSSNWIHLWTAGVQFAARHTVVFSLHSNLKMFWAPHNLLLHLKGTLGCLTRVKMARRWITHQTENMQRQRDKHIFLLRRACKCLDNFNWMYLNQ
jgi:hypothetical protein